MIVNLEIAHDAELRKAVKELVLGQVRSIMDTELGQMIDRVINERIEKMVEEKMTTALEKKLNKIIDDELGSPLSAYGRTAAIQQMARSAINEKIAEFIKYKDLV